MIMEDKLLGHMMSEQDIEFDKAKEEVIKKLPPPINVKEVRSFLGYAGFYRQFIRNFSKIFMNLLIKEVDFNFDQACLDSFYKLKEALISTPIMQTPNWSLSFEVICNESDYAIEVVLGQRKEGKVHAIYYANKTLNDAQVNYVTTKKELLAVVFVLTSSCHISWDPRLLFI